MPPPCVFVASLKMGLDRIVSHMASSSNWFGEVYLTACAVMVSACWNSFKDFGTDVGSNKAIGSHLVRHLLMQAHIVTRNRQCLTCRGNRSHHLSCDVAIKAHKIRLLMLQNRDYLSPLKWSTETFIMHIVNHLLLWHPWHRKCSCRRLPLPAVRPLNAMHCTPIAAHEWHADANCPDLHLRL